jgi:hypothetical protein
MLAHKTVVNKLPVMLKDKENTFLAQTLELGEHRKHAY